MKKAVFYLSWMFITLFAMNSCTQEDNPSSPVKVNLTGQWIGETVSADGNQLILIYQFYEDATGWKETYEIKDGEVISQPISRYDSEFQFNYAIEDNSKVVIDYVDSELGDEVLITGSVLKAQEGGKDLTLTFATKEQMEKYQQESDDWHGGADESENPIDLTTIEADYTAENHSVLTGKLAESLAIWIEAGDTVTLKDVTIDAGQGKPGIRCLGNATIFVEGTNTVKGAPGITVDLDEGTMRNRLIIRGKGTLNAIGYDNFAGIGSGYGTSCGKLFLGAVIHATGGKYAAGIGAGFGDPDHPSRCNDIYVVDGEVTAIGGENAAGIGTGYGLIGEPARTTPKGTSSCSGVMLRGGVVKATGGANCPGIGIGISDKEADDLLRQGPRCGTVHITAAVKQLTSTKGANSPYSIGLSSRFTKGAINDIVFGRTMWYNGAKFMSEEYEKQLKENTFVYPPKK